MMRGCGLVAGIMAVAMAFDVGASQADEPAVAANESFRTHYRAYSAAYEAGDLAIAAQEADAALAAHEQSEPANPTRAVLAVNAAIVRLEALQGPQAMAALARIAALPANTAPVEPRLFALLDAHARLLADPRTSVDQALAALEAAPRDDPTLSRRAFFLSQIAGAHAFALNDFARSERAWRIFLTHTDAGDLPPAFMRGRGLTAIGASQVRRANMREAFDTFTQAMNTLAPFAGETQTQDMTPGQKAWAEALAWRAAVRAFRASTGGRIRDSSPQTQPRPLLEGAPPLCPGRVVAEPLPNSPVRARRDGIVGAAVLRFSLNAAGEVTASEIAAFVPDQSFGDAVALVAPLWRFELTDDAPEGCRIARVGDLVAVAFLQ